MRIYLLCILSAGLLTAAAQSDKYVSAMQKNLSLFDSAKTVQDFRTVSNSFERIAESEKNQWLPYYYAGLALSTIGWTDPNIDKDENSMRINAFCDKAAAINNNAEIYILRNMAATQAMMVDPQTRWQTFGAEASNDLKKSEDMDPNNPRIYYLRGMSLFNTPPAYGGGKDKAKPLFEKAVALYKTYNVKPLYPNWGEKQSVEMLARCQ